jgi:plasmid replication initiation protein
MPFMQTIQVWENQQIEHEPKDRWIAMTNALARAGSGLSLAEKRLVMAAIAKLDSRREIPINVPCVRITAREYAETYDLDESTAYVTLKQASKDLFKRTISFYEAEYRRLKRNKKPKLVEMHWIGEAVYSDGEGWIELFFWPRIVPHLMGLRKRFTSYKLMQTHSLRSIHSWKLLELLTSYAKEDGSGWMEISIEDFWTSMEISETMRKNFAWTRAKVLEPAIKELREKDHWLIEWRKTNFGGRRVQGLRFSFQRNPQASLFV